MCLGGGNELVSWMLWKEEKRGPRLLVPGDPRAPPLGRAGRDSSILPSVCLGICSGLTRIRPPPCSVFLITMKTLAVRWRTSSKLIFASNARFLLFFSRAQADEDVLEEWKALDATGNAKAGAVYENEEDRCGASMHSNF